MEENKLSRTQRRLESNNKNENNNVNEMPLDNNNSNTETKNKEKKKKKIVTWKRVLLAIVLLIIFWIVYLFYNLNNTNVKSDLIKGKDIGSEPSLTLIVGVDGLSKEDLNTKEGQHEKNGDQRSGIRSDSIQLMATNPKKDTIRTMSIYRDLLSKNVCSGNYGKLNESFTSGWYKSKSDNAKDRIISGVECLTKTIENYYDLKIDNFAVINFSGFENIIDSVGGITIDEIIGGNQKGTKFCEQDKFGNGHNPSEASWAQGKNCFTIGQKNIDMDGDKALSYARHRHSDDDRWRGKRQGQVMQAVSKSLSSPWNILKLPFTSNSFSSAVTTNISPTSALWFKLKNMSDLKIEHIDITYYNNVQNGIYYLNISDAERINAERKLKDILK